MRHEPSCPIHALHAWEGGKYLHLSDEIILAEAHRQGLTLVTRDIESMGPIVRTWYLEGRGHSGVIFVDDRTIPEGNVGALVTALIGFWRVTREYNWENVCAYLPG